MEKETLIKSFNWLLANWEFVITLIALAYQTYMKFSGAKTLNQVKDILINTLKIDEKMKKGEFSNEIINKVDEIATQIKAGKEAINEVKLSLKNNKKGFMKIGSYKGKPIHFTDAFDIFKKLKVIFYK